MAEERGFFAESCAHKNMAYDFVVRGLKVQVKHRKTGPTGFVKLCSTRRARAAKEAYYLKEFDVLALRCDGSWYLIPSFILAAGDGQTIVNRFVPSNYKSYIDNWGAFLGDGVAKQSMQLRLTFEEPCHA